MSSPILTLPYEERLWLETKMRQLPLIAPKEILTLYEEKFPFRRGLITSQSINAYRKRLPGWRELKKLNLERLEGKRELPQEELEAEILKEVKEAEDASEEFTKDAKQKVNQLKAHRQVLKELWQNYSRIRDSKEEVSKSRYLEHLSKELVQIGELEISEKSLLAAMDTIRQAELKQSIKQHFDSLISFFIPRMMEKSSSGAEALEYVFRLNLFLNDYSKLLLNYPVAEANRVLLEKLYTIKKLEEVEK